MNKTIEICTDSYLSATNADIAGANRIELCSALELGGLTPSYALVKELTNDSKIAVNVLIRPRGGNFVYSDAEFRIMCENINIFKTLNINAIVSGVLLENGEIDIERTKKLVEIAKPLEFTFHRAFDNCPSQEKAIVDVIKTGANRLLTSGGFANVDEGKNVIIDLHKKYGNQIIVMPGSGINENNASVFLNAGISEIHLSASVFKDDMTYKNPKLGNMGYIKEGEKIGYKVSSIEKIKAIVGL